MCHRIWLAGYRIVYAYKSVIYHKMGATSSGMNNAFIQYHSFKNRIRAYIKNFGTIWFWTILPFHIALCQLYALLSFTRGNWQLASAIERAFWWNIQHFPETMVMRTYIRQNIRTVLDSIFEKSVLVRPKIGYYKSMISGNLVSYKDA